MFIPDNATLDMVVRSVILMALSIGFIVFWVNILGLRTFSKMTPFDFVATVAVGTLLGSAATSTDWLGFVSTLVSISALFAVQFILAKLRMRSKKIEEGISNCPRLLMRDGVFDEDALKKARVSKGDLMAKLREANALEFDKVRAVVLETTGDVSVLHGDSFDDRLLEGVEGFD